MQETPVPALGQEEPLEKEMATHSGILAGKSHGQRSLAGYSPWGRKELDMTEWLSTQWLINPTLHHSEQGKRELEDSKAEKGT